VKSVAKTRSAVDYRVFLSHAHKDRWIAKQCARLIEEAAKPHVKVFFDEKDIEGGQSIPDSVRTGIEKCDEFVVMLSRYSKDRAWVLIEMGADKAIDLNDFDQYISQFLKRTKVGR
jgi:hypothetical protein